MSAILRGKSGSALIQYRKLIWRRRLAPGIKSDTRLRGNRQAAGSLPRTPFVSAQLLLRNRQRH